jgi:predicted nucleic acid-binding protein
MKAVLDTGIFISALISSQGLPYQAVDLWIDRCFDLVTSTWQIQELREVSRYPRIAPLVAAHHVGTIVNRIRNYATVLDTRRGDCEEPLQVGLDRGAAVNLRVGMNKRQKSALSFGV